MGPVEIGRRRCEYLKLRGQVDVADTGGNPLTLTMPYGFSVDRASQVYWPSSGAKAVTEVIPANPLPDKVPWGGDKMTRTATADAEEHVLHIDLAASSATVFVMRRRG
jgi:hypothetical protein